MIGNTGNNELRPPYVSFEMREFEDRQATIDTGQLTFKEIPYAIITPAGSKDQVERVAVDWLKMIEEQANQGRFPLPWVSHYQTMFERWKAGQELPLNGRSLADWPPVNKTMYNLLRQINIHTIEDLAASNEEAIQRIGMGGRALVERAKAYVSLDLAQPEKLHALEVENKDLHQQVKELSETVKQLKLSIETKTKA